MLCKISEDSIIKKELIGKKINNTEKRICKLIDIVYDRKEKDSNIDYEFFDIKGTALLYGPN